MEAILRKAGITNFSSARIGSNGAMCVCFENDQLNDLETTKEFLSTVCGGVKIISGSEFTHVLGCK